MLTGFIILFVALPATTWAQNGPLNSGETNKVVRNIRFVGNDEVNDNTLETLIRTRTNREFLGIPRFTPWYFLWKVSHKFGEPPALLNRRVLGTDIERIQTFYESRGFLEVQVDTSVVEFQKNKVEVSFLIHEGEPSRIQTIAYSGMPQIGDKERIVDFYRDSRLTRDQINDSTFSVNRQYSSQALSEERNRIIDFLKNNGYAAAQRDSIVALVRRDTTNRHLLDVLFRIHPGSIYHFGNVYVRLSGPDQNISYDETDTLKSEEYAVNGQEVILQKEDESQSRFRLLSDQLMFKAGDTFNNSLYLRTLREFQNLGMMNIRRFGLSQDGGLPDYSQSRLPVIYEVQTVPKHQLSTEFYGMRRYGFGAGAGLTYTNNNLFGRAENLQLSLNGSFEYVSSATLDEIYSTDSTSAVSRVFRSGEARLDYSVPRLNFPFVALDDQPLFSNARTRYSLVYGQSNQINFNINADIRFNLRYEVTHNNKFSSYLDLIELDWLDTTPSADFNRSLEEQFGKDSFELKRIKEDFRPQFSSIIRYSLRNSNTDLIKRNHGHYAEYTIAMGGNIPYLIDRYFVTPDTLENNLPSLFYISGNSLSYSRFFKVSADYRRYIPISNRAVFAWRVFGGYAQPYGNSKTIPLNRRFFAGGSNDIRGWAPYRLGPGDIAPSQVSINGGDIKLAAFTEVRQRFARNILSADWYAAWYNDAGNVWYGPRVPSIQSGQNNSSDLIERGKFDINRFYKQIAVSTGLGLRLDWDYIVLRLDFSMRAHDLQAGWFNNNQVYFSFGLGHSF